MDVLICISLRGAAVTSAKYNNISRFGTCPFFLTLECHVFRPSVSTSSLSCLRIQNLETFVFLSKMRWDWIFMLDRWSRRQGNCYLLETTLFWGLPRGPKHNQFHQASRLGNIYPVGLETSIQFYELLQFLLQQNTFFSSAFLSSSL